MTKFHVWFGQKYIVWELNTIYIHVSLHVLSGMNLVKLTNNAVFSKTGKQFWKEYKITSSKMIFFHFIKSTFAVLLLLHIRCHVNRLPRWKPTIATQLYADCITHTMWYTLGLIQHSGQVMQISVIVSYIVEARIKEITLLPQN